MQITDHVTASCLSIYFSSCQQLRMKMKEESPPANATGWWVNLYSLKLLLSFLLCSASFCDKMFDILLIWIKKNPPGLRLMRTHPLFLRFSLKAVCLFNFFCCIGQIMIKTWFRARFDVTFVLIRLSFCKLTTFPEGWTHRWSTQLFKTLQKLHIALIFYLFSIKVHSTNRPT